MSCKKTSRVLNRGVALLVALVILAVMSLLAVSGMRRATTELLMAGNEQNRLAASAAASAGIEQTIAWLTTARGSSTAAFGPTALGPAASYRAGVQRRGEESTLPGFSAEKFAGVHYEIESTGSAPRAATDTQVQGVLVVESNGQAPSRHSRLGGGL